MLIGIVFIIAGIGIALFPELLAIIVASLLILAGVIWVSLALYFRRHRQQMGQSMSQIFFRF